MRARWWLLLSFIFIALGFIIPYVLMYMNIQNSGGDWGSIAWILVAPALYMYISAILWVLAFIFLIVAIVVYKKRRKRR